MGGYSRLKFWFERAAIWHREKETSDDVVSEKIESAFRNVKSFPLERIIFQFWRPVTTTATGARVLSCSGTPFALSRANRSLNKYRSGSCLYCYGVMEAGDPMIIRGGPPIIAFLTKFPEVVLDLRVQKETPLVDLALECELTCFMMLPLFHETSCVGVIEVSARFPSHLLVLYYELHCKLKRVGLSIARPQAISLPIKALPGDFNACNREILKALKVVVQSHAITLAQVWVPYVNVHGQMSCRIFGKLVSHCVNNNSDSMSLVKHFYLDVIFLPWRKGPALLGRTLVTRQPQLCRNIHKFTENKGLMAILSANTKSACFVICLRSSHTGDVDHLFEFFWPQQRDHLALMEALVLTLRQHLPSFKYDSGAELGDQLLVGVDVEHSSSASGSTTVKIFPENKSPGKRALVGMKRKTRESVGTTRRITRASVRIERESLEGQSEPIQGDLVILAVYQGDKSLFFLPSSATFESLMEKVNMEFKLNPSGTYTIKYSVLPGKWYILADDTCFKSCISSYQASKNIDHIKLVVLAVEN